MADALYRRVVLGVYGFGNTTKVVPLPARYGFG